MTAFWAPGSAIALLVAGAFFMENLDGTVVVTAMPQMGVSFGVHAVDLNAGISVYMLTLAMLIPASGWIADRFGARLVFAAAIAIFTVASIVCGLCQNLTMFTFARIFQGVGGAMMVPVGRLVILRSTPKHELMRAIATITWPGLAAPMLGPPLGGFITTYASWRWIFFLNVPLGLCALALALRLIPEAGEKEKKPFDYIGFVLTSVACFAIMYSLDLIGGDKACWRFPALGLVSGLGVGAIAALHAKRQTYPLVDLRALRVRSYAVTIWGGSLFRIATASIPFLLPLLFQVGFGLNAFASGLLVLAVFAGNLVMKPFTTPILRRFRFRHTLIVNGLLNAAAIFACAFLTPTTPVAIIATLLFIGGLTRSMQFTALNTLAFADVPEDRMSGANVLFNVVQQMAMGMGVALGAVVLRLAALVDPGAQGVLALDSFHIAFVAVGIVALLGLPDALSLHAKAGDAVRHRRARATPSAAQPEAPAAQIEFQKSRR